MLGLSPGIKISILWKKWTKHLLLSTIDVSFRQLMNRHIAKTKELESEKLDVFKAQLTWPHT